MEEQPPFELLSEAVMRARDSAVPPEATPGGRDLAEGFLGWARMVLATTQTLQYRSMDLPISAGGVELAPVDVIALMSSNLLSDTFDFVVLEEGERHIKLARRRLPELPALLISKPVNTFAARYLARIATLYLWGFDVEVHVMCRAVLDAALQELIPGEVAKDLLPRRKRARQVTLHDRLCLARFTSPILLNDEDWAIAWKLREDGNDVLHQDVDHTLYYPNALEAMQRLQTVLEAMPPTGAAIVVNPISPTYDFNERPPV